MEILQKYALWLHILAGGVALIVGLIPMISEKGSQLHKQAGNVYFWAMFVVFITALCRFRPEMRLIFLDCIAVFSFYNTFSGRRLVQLKDKTTPKFIDWFAVYTAMIFAFVMLGIAVWAVINNVVFLWVTLGFFGWRCLRMAFIDWQIFTGRKHPENLHWFYNHIARMIGSYIATLTAFLVVNNKGYIPDLVAWLTPALIGIFTIVRLTAHYRAKFKQDVVVN